jgi:ABC-2 type transport system permease protein
MKQFMAFVKKEFDHIFRDTWTMIILLLLPVMMLLLFGYALSTEVKNTGIAVYDPSKDSATEKIINLLSKNGSFTVTRILDSPVQIESVLRRSGTGLVVVFSDNFYGNMLHTGDARVQLIADGTDPNTAVTIINYATSIINEYKQRLSASGTVSSRIHTVQKLLYNPEMKSSYTFVPGVMGMVIILICAMMTSVSIAREKETGTMEVLLVSPMNPLLIILSKAVPYFVLSCINLATILLLAVFVLGVPIAGSLLVLILISLLFIFVSLSLGLLISTVAETQIAALLVSGMVLMMPVMYLSGMLFPVENMPVFLQVISKIMPASWYISAVKKIMIMGLKFPFILQETLVLADMAVFLVTVSFKKFKIRLE